MPQTLTDMLIDLWSVETVSSSQLEALEEKFMFGRADLNKIKH